MGYSPNALKISILFLFVDMSDLCSTLEETEWILDYCDRHGISRGKFKFDNDLDELF